MGCSRRSDAPARSPRALSSRGGCARWWRCRTRCHALRARCWPCWWSARRVASRRAGGPRPRTRGPRGRCCPRMTSRRTRTLRRRTCLACCSSTPRGQSECSTPAGGVTAPLRRFEGLADVRRRLASRTILLLPASAFPEVLADYAKGAGWKAHAAGFMLEPGVDEHGNPPPVSSAEPSSDEGNDRDAPSTAGATLARLLARIDLGARRSFSPQPRRDDDDRALHARAWNPDGFGAARARFENTPIVLLDASGADVARTFAAANGERGTSRVAEMRSRWTRRRRRTTRTRRGGAWSSARASPSGATPCSPLCRRRRRLPQNSHRTFKTFVRTCSSPRASTRRRCSPRRGVRGERGDERPGRAVGRREDVRRRDSKNARIK